MVMAIWQMINRDSRMFSKTAHAVLLWMLSTSKALSDNGSPSRLYNDNQMVSCQNLGPSIWSRNYVITLIDIHSIRSTVSRKTAAIALEYNTWIKFIQLPAIKISSHWIYEMLSLYNRCIIYDQPCFKVSNKQVTEHRKQRLKGKQTVLAKSH